jgi:hypothetical protein
MRCFFHLRHEQELIVDTDGLEVSHIEAVHAYALEAIQELRQETGLVFDDWQGWQLIVVDEGGEILLSFCLDRPLLQPEQGWSSAGGLRTQQSGTWTTATAH